MFDAKFMSATEKEMVLKQWTTFVKNGFKFDHFTDRLYNHLIQHCSFIAHYNRLGFYGTYFENPEDTMRFLKQFDKDFSRASVEYGWALWVNDREYEDINKAMCEAIEPYKKGAYEKCLLTGKERDLACATSLFQKHGIRMEVAKENSI